jgi:replicative DNA helicase
MIEYSIIKLFIENNELYEKYHGSLKLDFIRQNYPILYKCFQSLPVNSIEGLEASYLANYPVIKEGDREIVRNTISAIDKAEATEEEIIPYLESHLGRAWASELSLMALDVAEGRRTVDHLDEIVAKRESSITILDESTIEFVSTDIEELIQEEDLAGGLTWRLKCLNQSLGPLRKGNFGHIFARVETGKTAMWISESMHMALQVEKPILIFFNEEGGRDVVFRMYNAITGLTYLEIASDPKRAKALWDSKIGDRIKFIDQPSQVERKVMEKTIETIDPALIIVDNMDKVKGFSGDRKDLLLHEIYKWGREIAKEQCPVITVGQADGSGHNSKVLDESQMADSKTAKPSELDFIIGIGREDKEGYENVRYLTISKNKLRGDKNTVEEFRHMKARQVLLKPQFSIYEDM